MTPAWKKNLIENIWKQLVTELRPNKTLSPLLEERWDRQQSQRMLGYDDPTKAVWRCTSP